MAYMEFMNSKVVKDSDGKRKVLLRKEFICDTEDDIQNIGTSNLLMGSMILCATGGIWVLNSSKEWTKQ